jgi:hypothetical protein
VNEPWWCSEARAISRRSPLVVELSESDRAVLEQRSRGCTASFAEVVRAKIVLLGTEDLLNSGMAERLHRQRHRRARCFLRRPGGVALVSRGPPQVTVDGTLIRTDRCHRGPTVRADRPEARVDPRHG